MTTEENQRSALLAEALTRSGRHGFALSCETTVGRLLAVLAAATPPAGRILELGTGVGMGLAWLVHGLGSRTDVQLVSVERDPALVGAVLESSWPSYLELRTGDAETLLPTLGQFALIFADAEGGKWSGLDLTLHALNPGAILLVDDMQVERYPDPAQRAAITHVRDTLMTDARLVVADLPVSSGIMLATRRASEPSPD